MIENLSFKIDKGDLRASYVDNVTLQNCIIYGNNSINRGLLIEKCENVKVVNCIITNFKYGIFIRFAPSTILIKNSIISNNKEVGIFVSKEEGGQAIDSFGKPVELPKKGREGEIKVELEYNDIWGSKKNYYNCQAGEFDISKDPKFVSESDYRLQLGSPCIDAGDPDGKYSDPDGSRNDLGALPYGVKKE